MNKTLVIIATMLLLAVIAGCTPAEPVDSRQGLAHNLPVPQAVSAAKDYVMQKTGAAENKIIVLEAFEREWPDSCLGAAAPGEFCTQVITPGHEIKINAKGKEYQLRTNADGTSIRETSATDSQEIIAIN